MDFCIISPTAGLARYASLSRTHLVLPQVYIKDPAYKRYYQEHSIAGDLIILDNGAYEGKWMFDELSVETLMPNIIVLPDFYLQPWKKTWHAAQAFLDHWFDSYPEVNWCYIPQAVPGDYHGFIESYQCALCDDRISWIGIPRCLATDITCDPLARVNFARLVRRDKPAIRLHAFGMCNGDVHELPYLAAAGVNSVDSSAPVWRGWNGYRIQDPTWDGRAVNFNETIDYGLESLIMTNLEACGVDTRRRSNT